MGRLRERGISVAVAAIAADAAVLPFSATLRCPRPGPVLRDHARQRGRGGTARRAVHLCQCRRGRLARCRRSEIPSAAALRGAQARRLLLPLVILLVHRQHLRSLRSRAALPTGRCVWPHLPESTPAVMRVVGTVAQRRARMRPGEGAVDRHAVLRKTTSPNTTTMDTTSTSTRATARAELRVRLVPPVEIRVARSVFRAARSPLTS
jgi:hypothetical protein